MNKQFCFMGVCYTVLILISPAVISDSVCSLPKRLAGKEIVAAVDPWFSVQNPLAGSIMKLSFKKDGSYTNHIFTSNMVVKGGYEYKRLADNVGQLNAWETFDGKKTEYQYTLVCVTDYRGTAVYTQKEGVIKPSVRQNTSVYTLQDQGSH